MDADTRLKTEEKIIAMLKTVYDPEIPVNIYEHEVHTRLFRFLFPKAMEHNTPLQPINPVFNVPASIPGKKAGGIGRGAPNTV